MKKVFIAFAGVICPAALCVFGALKDANGNAVTETTLFGDVDGETGTVGELIRAGGAVDEEQTNEIASNAVEQHEAKKDNPHGVTAAQVGAVTDQDAAEIAADVARDEIADYLLGAAQNPTNAPAFAKALRAAGLATTNDVVAATNGLLRTESDPTVPAWAKAATKPTYTASEVGALASTVTHLSGDVPVTRKVNGKSLSADVTLGAADVGAVPTARTVNGKALSANITLGAADVGAYTKAQTDANVAESVASATNALAGKIVAPETIATNLIKTVMASSLFNLTYDPTLQVTWRKEADGGVFYERCYTNVNMTGVAP